MAAFGALYTSTASLLSSTSTPPVTEITPAFFEPPPSTSAQNPTKLCLGLHDVFIALFLVMLILLTIFGNVLVVLSVFVYKRMRTFTNILLTSLATADLLVGLVVMPLSLLDLLHAHRWPLGRFFCSLWATSDVLLCTASILNLCVISLDRYMAITSPLKYPRTRSRKMAAGLLSSVWLLSLIVCSPPWFITEWGLFVQSDAANQTVNDDGTFFCGYSPSVPYRIYSALGSFYIPLLVMLSVYFKIFRVASEREALMRQSIGTCRLSNRIVKTQAKNLQRKNQRARIQMVNAATSNGTPDRINYRAPNENFRHNQVRRTESRMDSTDCEDSPPGPDSGDMSATLLNHNAMPNGSNASPALERLRAMERECHSLADLADKSISSGSPPRKNTEVHCEPPVVSQKTQSCHNSQSRLQPSNLMAKRWNRRRKWRAQEHYQTCGPGKAVRGSKEKMVYLRERKALKTIGIVVLGFIICWMPFFVLYLVEVFADSLSASAIFKVLNEFFLWLGYSNSVLNPIIYTMYNGDFRRCFRDLLSFGCIQHHRRTMSVKKLHQQSTIF